MLRLSKNTDYAPKALAYPVEAPAGVASAREIAIAYAVRDPISQLKARIQSALTTLSVAPMAQAVAP